MVEASSKCEACECGREVVEWLIECFSKRKREQGRILEDWLIEKGAQSEVSES